MPRAVIGLPTFNGERYLRETLAALLAQDYPNFGLFISDNASTDLTAEICLEAARLDDRVTYRRRETNIGSVGNFNGAFEDTTGLYFMWAGDDDRWHPSYLRRCVEALEADDRAVMATTGLRFIDEAGQVIDADYAIYDNPDLSSDAVADRAAALVRRGGWYQIYGVARRDAIERTRRVQNVFGSDVVFTMEVAIQGPILKVPETLFWFRQYVAKTQALRAERQGHIANERRVLSAMYTHLQESLTDAIRASDLSWRMKSALTIDIMRAAYLEDTPLSRHARKEVTTRIRAAVADKDLAHFAKFALIAGSIWAGRSAKRARNRARGPGGPGRR